MWSGILYFISFSAVDGALLDDCTSLTSLLSSPPDCPPDTASWISNLPHCLSPLINVSYAFPALRPRGLGAPWFHPFMPHIPSVSRSVGSSFRVHPKSDHLSPLPHPGSSPIVSRPSLSFNPTEMATFHTGDML